MSPTWIEGSWKSSWVEMRDECEELQTCNVVCTSPNIIDILGIIISCTRL